MGTQKQLEWGVLRVIVGKATVRMGARRTEIQLREMADTREGEDFWIRWLRRFTYPSMVAGTLCADGFGFSEVMSFEDYLDLDEGIAREWLDAIIELNPHWDPARDIEKKSAAIQTSSIDG